MLNKAQIGEFIGIFELPFYFSYLGPEKCFNKNPNGLLLDTNVRKPPNRWSL